MLVIMMNLLKWKYGFQEGLCTTVCDNKGAVSWLDTAGRDLRLAHNKEAEADLILKYREEWESQLGSLEAYVMGVRTSG